jgi:hypothetical protein
MMDLNVVLTQHQPAVVIEGVFYIPSRQLQDDAPILMTATGNKMPMRRLAWCTELSERHFAISKLQLVERFRRDLERWVSQLLEGNLRRVCQLFAAVARSEAGVREADFHLMHTDTCQLSLEEAVDQLLVVAPRPEIPSPTLGLRGRLWRLRSAGKGRSDTRGKLHLRFGDCTFDLHGDFTPTNQLLAKWNDKLQSLLHEKADELVSTLDHDESEEIVAAREAVCNGGAYEQGDLLFVAGPPPYVARILPPLGGVPFGTVAVGVPVKTPLRASPLSIFRRHGHRNSWKQCSPGRTLCTGPNMPQLAVDPTPIEVLGYLRACAIRFAENNGRFSEFE